MTAGDDDPDGVETRRWRVNKISSVLVLAGHPRWEMAHGATSPFADPVRQAGFVVHSRPETPDCVYVEWIDHWHSRGWDWEYKTGLLVQALRDGGYTVEGPLSDLALSGKLRITRPAEDAVNEVGASSPPKQAG